VSRERVELNHIPALDGIRGLGVLGILFFHAGHLRGGWLGVDLFFVLSGFLITSLLLAEFEGSGRIALGRFWARRARRLLPALLLALLGVAAYAALFAEPGELGRIRGDGLATLFYVANWHGLLAGHDYWELFRSPSPLDHTWSLAIEEQFYLFWPPIAFLVLSRTRHPVHALFRVAAVGALLSALWMAWRFDEAEGTARVYFGTDTRAAATLVGSALAALLLPAIRRWPDGSSRVADVTSVGALVLLAFAWFGLEGTDPRVYRGTLLLLALAAGAVIAGVVLAPRGLAARGLAVAPLRGLGIVSYGLYLWHWPLYLVLTPDRTGLDGWTLTAVRIAASVAVASLSYVALERPIRRGALAPRSLAAAGAVGALLVVAALVGATRPAPNLPGEQRAGGGPAPDSTRSLVVVGDSVAETLGPALAGRAAARGLAVLELGHYGCLVLKATGLRFPNGLTLELAYCADVERRWRAAVSETGPSVVLILEGGAGIGDRRVQEDWLEPCSPAYDAAFADDLSQAIRFVEERGARAVVAITPPARLVDAPPRFQALWGGDDPAIQELLIERAACQNALRREVATRAGADVVDLAGFACPTGRCVREVDGVVLRPDGIHFAGEGARRAADWLLDRLVERGLLRPAADSRAGASR